MLENGLKIKIEKRSQPEWVLQLILLIALFNGFFINVLHFPSAIKYIADVLLILILLLAFINLNKKKVYVINEIKPIMCWVIAFLLMTIIVYAANYQSVLYYLWGMRNNFRVYILFFCSFLFLKKEDLDNFFKFTSGFFWANAVLCIMQFFLGFKGDFLGGFFGTEKGCNGYLNIFLVVISIKSVVLYLNKKTDLWVFLAENLMSLLLATLSEIKFFYLEFILILVVGSLLSNFSFRKLIIILIGGAAVVFAVWLLIAIFPHFAGFFSVENLFDSASTGGYSAADQLNRLTTIPVISENILKDDVQKWFGLGLGNCETSNFAFLKTPFYYNHILLRYNWFSTAFLFLETGFSGLIFFFGFFIAVIIACFFMLRQQKEEKEHCQMAIIAAFCCIVIGIYNSSLRTEAGFIIYFMLAFPFIVQKRAVLHE